MPGINRNLATILLFEGIASISIQLIALRQIVPFVGSSIDITSIVISGFLCALALGYKSASHITENFDRFLYRNLLLAAFLTAFCASYLFASAYFEVISFLGISRLLTVVVYTAFGMAPIVYLLAQSTVLLINYRSTGTTSGKAGFVLNLSTWGNVFGGLFTTLVIMYFLGVASAVTFATACLLICFMLLPYGYRPLKLIYSSLILCFSVVANNLYENSIFETTTPFANYSIEQREEGGLALISNLSSSSKYSPGGFGMPYIEILEDWAELSDIPARNVLVLGAGGFTFGDGRDFAELANITFVDVDPALEGLSQKIHGNQPVPGKFVLADARAFLINSKETHDLIILDTFTHQRSMPTHLVTKEFFNLIKSRIAEGGKLYVNVVFGKTQGASFKAGFDRTIRSVFDYCTNQHHTVANTNYVNALYACESLYSETRPVYTDRNNVALIDSSF